MMQRPAPPAFAFLRSIGLRRAGSGRVAADSLYFYRHQRGNSQRCFFYRSMVYASKSSKPIPESCYSSVNFFMINYMDKIIEESTTTKPVRRSRSDASIRQRVKLILVSSALLFYLFLFAQQWFIGLDVRLYDQIVEHYSVFLALPCAGFAALLLVVMFDEAYGEIKFFLLGFTFEGGSAPITMWVFCYLSIVFSIKLLW